MRVVIPSETDAAMNLDGVRGGAHVGICRGGFRERCKRGRLHIALGFGLRGVVSRGLRQLHIQQHVRTLMLDGLKGADGAAELHAHVGVGDRGFQQCLRAAHHLIGQRDGGVIKSAGQRRRATPRGTQQLRRGASEFDAGLLAGWIKRGKTAACHASCVPVDNKKR